jgi:ParB/RepB/Spo0J family partition protein
MNTLPSPAQVTNIRVDHIEKNPHNPRRLFDDEPMKILKESIKNLGVLVPLDVYPKNDIKTKTKDDRYVLLDGERRWRCANELGLKTVPVIIIAKPSLSQNILTMFHIHNVREGWQLMPTALQLKKLMKILKVKNERKLSELTKLTISQVRRCLILLTYPDKYQRMMLAPPTERYKADFFIDLHRIRGPAIKDKLEPWISRGDSKCVDIMISKYDDEIIQAVTEFRQLAAIYRGAQRINKVDQFKKQLDHFFTDHNMRISDIDIPGATFEQEQKEIRRSVRRLNNQINGLDLENISSYTDLIEELRNLAQIINNKLEEAYLINPKNGRR